MFDIQNNSFLADTYKDFMEAEGVTIPDRETQRKLSIHEYTSYLLHIYNI